MEISPLVIGSSPAMQSRAVDFPHPDGPEERDELPVRDGKGEAGERGLAVELLCHVPDDEACKVFQRASCRAAVYRIFAPTSLSHMSNASTSGFASSWDALGYCSTALSYAGRMTGLIRSWLPRGAMLRGTPRMAGPG